MERTLADYLTHAPVFVRQRDGVIVYWTIGAEELYGYNALEAMGKVSHLLLKTHPSEPLERIEHTLDAEGEWQGRLLHTAKDGRQIWTESVWRLRDPGGLVVEQNTDISPRVRLEQQGDVLRAELNHRVKNTLAVVQGLARMTFQRPHPPEFRLFEERLLALSEAHNLLMREEWRQAQLTELIGQVSEGLYARDRIEMHGPDVGLLPNAAVSYALAFHELCTNAIKHGALSVPSGRVRISWTVSDDDPPRIHLTWREVDGPKVVPPQRTGFGTQLIERAVAGELGTPVQMRFEEDGLVCEFDGPVQKEPDLPI